MQASATKLKASPSTIEKINVRAKEMLARLLAAENLTIVHKNVDTAYFDVKSRLLVLPNLDNATNTTYTGFIGHEVGHALFTPENMVNEVLSSAKLKDLDEHVVHKIMNVVEDARIEKLMKRRFCGLGPVFAKFYDELISTNEDFTSILSDIQSSTDKDTFLDRMNGQFKVGAHFPMQFTPEERKIYESVRDNESVEDVIDSIDTISSYLDPRRNKGKDTSDNSGNNKSDSQEDSESEGNNSSNGSSKDKSNTKSKNKTDKNDSEDKEDSNKDSSKNQDDSSQEEQDNQNDKDESEKQASDTDNESGDESGDDSSQEEQNEDGTTGETTSQGQGAGDGPGVTSRFQDALDKALEKTIQSVSSGKESQVVYIPDIDTKDVIIPFEKVYNGSSKATSTSVTQYTIFIKENNKSIVHLVQEFERKKAAATFRRVTISKTGAIDTNNIKKYKITDDIFKKNTAIKEGKNHGLIMFVDWSGSMVGSKVVNAVKQCIILSEFCRKSGIPFDVYTFTQQYSTKSTKVKTKNVLDYVPGSFCLVNALSSRMKAATFKNCSAKFLERAQAGGGDSLYWSMGGTPLNVSICAAFKMIPEFKKATHTEKVHLVILSDGDSHTMNNVFGEKGHDESIRLDKGGTLFTRHRESGKGNRFLHEKHSFAHMQTDSLLDLLQSVHDCHAMGFFVSDYDTQLPNEFYEYYSTKSLDEYAKKKYTILENTGYKQLYIMSNSLLNSQTAHTGKLKDIADNRKAKFILSEFIKHIA